MCEALLDGDGERFESSLDDFLIRTEAVTRKRVDSDRISAEELATEGQVSVEGLALVVLAERAGLPVRDDNLLVPSLAREGDAPSLGPDAWLDLDG